MNEIQQYLYDNWGTYGVGMLTSSQSIEFIKLCEKNDIPIHGFDGFHRRVDNSPTAIQIDQSYSADYSNVDPREAVDRAAKSFTRSPRRRPLAESVTP
jgi:hypothetical protein